LDGERTLERVRRWLSSGFYLGANNVITPLFSLVSSIILTRLLTPEDYGSYAFFLSSILILDFTSLSGIGTALIRSTARGFPGTLRPATGARVRASLLGSAVLLVLAAYRLAAGHRLESLLYVACAVSFPFYFPYTNVLYQLIGLREYRRLVAVQTLQLVVSYVPLFIVALATADFRMVLLTHLVTTPLSRYLSYWRMEKRLAEDAAVEEGYLRYGANVTAMGMLGTLETHLDRIVLGSFFSSAALAVFHVGKTIGFQGRNVWNVVYQFVFASLSRRAASEEGFPRLLFLVGAIYLGALGVFYLLAPWVVVLFYPSEYRESALTAQWFLLASALGGPASIFDTYFHAAGWMWASWGGRIIKALSYFGSLYFLVFRFEIDGFYYAAAGSSALHSVVGAILLFAGNRLAGKPRS
jgi:O-antigen/teichoic acid export membrane protein